MSEGSVHSDFIPPVRGLVLAQNAKGRPVPTVDLERWIRLNRVVYKTDKIDVAWQGYDLNRFEALVSAARELDSVLSLRTDCSEPPPPVESLRHAAPWDVFLSPPPGGDVYFMEWLSACSEAGISIRVQYCAPLKRNLDVSALPQRFADSGVTSVNLAAWDPLLPPASVRGAVPAKAAVEQMNALVAAIHERGIEVNLLRLPFCVVDDHNRQFVLNERQILADHQQYQRDSFELACRLRRHRPSRIRLILLIQLEQSTSTSNPIDRIILPWIMDHPWVRARVWAFHKLTRHRHQGMPEAHLQPTSAEYTREAEHFVEKSRSGKGPICAACSLRRICDGLTPELKRAFPGLSITAQEGDAVIDLFHFADVRPRYYDTIDAARRDAGVRDSQLAKEANSIVRNQPASREIDAFAYHVEGTWSWPLPGCLRWFSFSNTEKVSSPLARLDPPFTLSVTFGGGIAEYIGFGLGRAARLVCPMTAYTHRLVLHVAADGRYVLLRDGVPVRPVEFVGAYYAPARLGRGLEPRIAIWNIDGTIGTQAVCLWEGQDAAEAPALDIRFSIVVVSTRYARRLQACLENIAYQRGVDLNQVEVIVAFVPGLDATEDVLDSIALAHPGLHIVPTAFAEEHAKTKGLLLNECLAKARGDWVLVLDADVLLAPNMLVTLAKLPEDRMFAIPDGRKMLTRETTARVLLGELRPWESWQELLQSAGEYRMREADGVPVGYCQCVRRQCLEKVQYEEMHHFEGADWKFGKDMRERFGMETRLSGIPVLHLDHGSSNWYGTTRHY